MQSRALTTQAQILTQLNNPPMPFSCTSVSSINLVPSEDPQDQLNQMADQASNFGFGCGVALRKAIDHGQTLCENLKKHYGDLMKINNHNRYFLDDWIYSGIVDAVLTLANKEMTSQCEKHVEEMKVDLASSSYSKMQR